MAATVADALPKQGPQYPALEPQSNIVTHRSDYLGPTEESNWVLLGHMLVGAFPSAVDDRKNAELLNGILNLGITTFVCLQQEFQLHGVTEYMWRKGLALRPYIHDAFELMKRNDNKPDSKMAPSNKLDFVHFPIQDCNVGEDDLVLDLCRGLCARVAKGEVIYLHCWGGHGRTGTVISIMLHLMYGLSADEAMNYCQFVHDIRICPVNVGSPQTMEQRAQVERCCLMAQQEAAAARAVMEQNVMVAMETQQQQVQQQQQVPNQESQPVAVSQSAQQSNRALWANGTAMPMAQRRRHSTGGRKHRPVVAQQSAKAGATKALPAPPPPRQVQAHNKRKPSKKIQQLRLKQAQMASAYGQPIQQSARGQYRGLCTGTKRPLNTPSGPSSSKMKPQQLLAVGMAPASTRPRVKLSRDGKAQQASAHGSHHAAAAASHATAQQQQQKKKQAGHLLKPGIIRPLRPPTSGQAMVGVGDSERLARKAGEAKAKRPATVSA